MVNVSVLLPEAAAATEYLLNHFSRDRLTLLRARLEDLYRSIRWLEDADRPFVRASCAFLDDNESCMIHPIRPLLCRSVTSTDPARCRDALVAQVFGEPPVILSNLFQSRLFEEAFIALGQALERTGYDHRSRTLTESVLEFLQTSLKHH